MVYMRRFKRGLSLMEIIVSLAVLGIVTSAVYALFHAGLRSFQKGESQVDLANRARFALDHMTRTLSASTPFLYAWYGHPLALEEDTGFAWRDGTDSVWMTPETRDFLEDLWDAYEWIDAANWTDTECVNAGWTRFAFFGGEGGANWTAWWDDDETDADADGNRCDTWSPQGWGGGVPGFWKPKVWELYSPGHPGFLSTDIGLFGRTGLAFVCLEDDPDTPGNETRLAVLAYWFDDEAGTLHYLHKGGFAPDTETVIAADLSDVAFDFRDAAMRSHPAEDWSGSDLDADWRIYPPPAVRYVNVTLQLMYTGEKSDGGNGGSRPPAGTLQTGITLHNNSTF